MTIKMKPEGLSTQRRNDPKRRAELEAFEVLAKLDLEGHALYEFRWRPEGQQVDFALWVNHTGRYAAQVKGGHYRWDGGEKWYLRALDGRWERKPSPIEETVDGRIEMHDAIQEATGFYAYVGGFLILPDTPRDRELERFALNRDGVYICWNLEELPQDLERAAKQLEFRQPPTRAHSENESGRVYELQGRRSDEHGRSGPRPATPTEHTEPNTASDLPFTVGTATFNIQNLEQLIVQQYQLNPDAEGNFHPPQQ